MSSVVVVVVVVVVVLQTWSLTQVRVVDIFIINFVSNTNVKILH